MNIWMLLIYERPRFNRTKGREPGQYRRVVRDVQQWWVVPGETKQEAEASLEAYLKRSFTVGRAELVTDSLHPIKRVT